MKQSNFLIYFVFLLVSCTTKEKDTTQLKVVSAQEIYFNGKNQVDTSQFKIEFEKWANNYLDNGSSLPKILYDVAPNADVDVSRKVKQILRKYHKEITLAYSNVAGVYTLIRLPPPLDEKIDFSFIRKRNLFHLIISGENIYRDTISEATRITKGELAIISKKFIEGSAQDSLLPELKKVEFPEIGKVYTSAKHVFVVEYYPITTYEQYSSVIDIIRLNYKKVRNENSQKYYSQEYNMLQQNKREIINSITPMVISEL